MEGSKGGAVFDSLNVNPQLFVNEILNSVDEIVDGGLEFYEREAAHVLSVKDENDLAELSKGVSAIKHVIQASLHKHLVMWEKYCLTHCFAVPEEFSLLQNDSSEDALLLKDVLHDSDLDAKIDFLSEKLILDMLQAQKESNEIQRERCALENHAILSRSSVDAITGAVEILDDSSVNEMFQELLKTASEIRMKMGNLMAERMEAVEYGMDENAYRSIEFQPSRLGDDILTNCNNMLKNFKVVEGS